MQINYSELVQWDEQAERYVFQGEFLGAKSNSLPMAIFGCLDDCEVRGANGEILVSADDGSIIHSFSGAFAGVVSSSSVSEATGLGTDEMLAHSDFDDEFFRLGLVLSDDKPSSVETVKKLLDHANSLGECLELASD